MALLVITPKAQLAGKGYGGDRFRESLPILGMLPIITFIKVDLPAPLRPISPTRDLGGNAAVALSRIVRPPRRTVMALMFSMANVSFSDEYKIGIYGLRAPLAHCAHLAMPQSRWSAEGTSVRGARR